MANTNLSLVAGVEGQNTHRMWIIQKEFVQIWCDLHYARKLELSSGTVSSDSAPLRDITENLLGATACVCNQSISPHASTAFETEIKGDFKVKYAR
jgi:hypothetical protein